MSNANVADGMQDGGAALTKGRKQSATRVVSAQRAA